MTEQSRIEEAADAAQSGSEVESSEPEAGDAQIVDETPAHPDAATLGLELPSDPDEAQALLLRELAEAREAAGEYLETLQRIAADFDNYRKRVERDYKENAERSSQRVIERLLPTLDNLDAALAYDPQTPAEEKILEGMHGTRTALLDALGSEGFEPIAALGEPFDPAVHEAVGGGGEGELRVGQELRRGYTLHGRVLRPSLVMVEANTESTE